MLFIGGISGLSGLSGLSGIAGGGSSLPPNLSDIAVYYSASLNTTLSGSPSTNYGKIDNWAPAIGTGDLVQATDAQRNRFRSAPLQVVYNNFSEAFLNLDNTTISINRRAASFFAVVENERCYAFGTAENRVLMSIPGIGDLYISCPNTSAHATLVWKDAGGDHDTGFKVMSSVCLVGVVLDAASIRVYLNDQVFTVGTPLSAGSTTGFSLFQGSFVGGQDRFVGGIAEAVWYSKALSAGEVITVQDWAKSKGAAFNSNAGITKHLLVGGDSLASGYHAEGNLSTARRHYLQLGTSSAMYHNLGFGGMQAATFNTVIWPICGTNYHPVGVGLHNFNRRQVMLMMLGSNDLVGADSAVTITNNLLTIREFLKMYGYLVVYMCIPPRNGLTGPQETKRLAVNANMMSADFRRYGVSVDVPGLLTNPLDLNYYDPDGIHLKKAGFDLYYTSVQTAVDDYMARPVTTVQVNAPLNGNLQDTSAFERDFTAIGSPTFIPGLFNRQALRCTAGGNAAKGYQPLGHLDYLPLTIICWAKTTVTGAFAYFVSKQSDTGGSQVWSIAKKWNEHIVAGVSGLTGELDYSGTFNDDVWRAIALVIDNSGGKLYVSSDSDPANFALRDSKAWSTVPVVPVTVTGRGELRLGSYNDATTYASDLQDVSVRFEALSLAQLQAIVPEIGAGSPPNAAINVGISYDIGTSTHTLSWDDGGGDAFGWHIWKTGDVSSFFTTASTSHNFDGEPGATYYVVAYNDFGESAPSDTAEAKEEPSQPQSLSLNDVGGGDFDVNWSAPASDGADAIILYQGYVNGIAGFTATPPTTTANVTLSPGDEVYVTAINSIGESAPSSTETVP